MRRRIGVAFPAMVASRVLGAAISPLLFAHAPVLLILMSPFFLHLVFVGPLLDPVVYFPVALTVTITQALIGFTFGRTYGTKALVWVLDRVPLSDAVAERLLALMRRTSALAIFVVPGPVLGTIAGVAGVRKKIFYTLVGPAQAMWVTAGYFVGEALLEYIEIARAFVMDRAFALTGITVTIMILRWLYGQYKSRKHEQVAAEIAGDSDASSK